MSSQRGPKMALEEYPGGRRRKGRPRKRWLDDVQDDMIKMGVKRWRTKSMGRGEWRRGGQNSSRIVEPRRRRKRNK
jgi:hypothetical protein